MYQTQSFHPASPLLGRCEPSLPAVSYYDPAWFERELKQIWARNWIYVGRANDLPAMTVRRVSVAGQNLILVKDQEGSITCFHNTCRHRGSELCGVAERGLTSRLIVCPYHQWSYSLAGALASTPFVSLTDDFRKEDHGLFPVHVREWNGFVFVCLADEAPDFAKAPDLGPAVYDNWPMRELVTGHTMVTELACNWKIFWENFNECLHCPGIHPDLCDMVPVYKQGIMAHEEAVDWTPEKSSPTHNLKPGARTWTMNGQPCGPEFSRLTDAERNAGHTFVTLLPTMFVVAHVDYVRAVSLRPLGAETTELKAEWLFPEATLKTPGFHLGNVVEFASKVIRQDGDACEMNQRGLRSSKFTRGVLTPQEYAIFQFHEWVRRHMEEAGS
jgi:Rieske 2Fe-2S family protein